MFITSQDVTEAEVHKFYTEASSLGLKPGQVPGVLPTNLGNGEDFVLHEGISSSEKFVYRQLLGCISLIIFND